MEVVGDDWNILELHWTTCKFLLVFCHFLPRAVFAKGLQSSRSFIGNSSSTSFQLPQNSDLFVTSRVKAYSVRKQMHCSQRSSSCMEPCAPPAFVCLFFFSENGGYPKSAKLYFFKNCILNDAIERADFVPPASCRAFGWSLASGRAWSRRSAMSGLQFFLFSKPQLLRHCNSQIHDYDSIMTYNYCNVNPGLINP